MTVLRVDLHFVRISCLCTLAGFLFFLFSACVDKPDVITTYKSFRLTVVSTGQLSKNATDPLPKEVIELALPLRNPQNCPDAAFFAQVDLTRLDIEPLGNGNATLVNLDPDSLEKDAQEQLSVAEKFVGKKPDFNIIRNLALQKLMNQNSGDVAAIPRNRDVQITADLANVFEKARATKVFLSPSFGEVEKDKLSQELQLTTAADEKELFELIAKELCDRSRNAGENPTTLNIIVLYKSPLEKDSIQLLNSVSQKKEPSPDAQRHLQHGMTYISLAKSAKQRQDKEENFDNAVLEFSQAIYIENDRQSCYANAYMNRGATYMLQGSFNLALTDLNKAADCDPENPMIRYNVATLHSLQNQHDIALVALDKALELGFNDCDALRKDSDLGNIRNRPEFRRILEKNRMFCF